jgi:adenylosuccinate synthase
MRNSLFERTGAHVLVDGQYGSTGKGVLAAWLAFQNGDWTDTGWKGVISNAGPNSGHTFYHQGEKHVLKQLPTFAVASYLLGNIMPVYLSAGAIIDPEILTLEALKYPGIPIFVHPNAAVITPHDKYSEADPAGSIAAVAGTRSGTGMALARKVMRDPSAVFSAVWPHDTVANITCMAHAIDASQDRYFVEVSQGFSLGINQPFYPKVTSRECTVSQAIADAGIPPRHVVKTYMSVRTYPIRVGNVDGHSSGDWYPDQHETSWEELGVEPELTTVTKRVRRVASFSQDQFEDAVRTNDPDFVFLNFLNYPGSDFALDCVKMMRDDANRWYDIIGGYGPHLDGVKVL